MKTIPSEDILELVGCEIDRRPDAPGIDDLTQHIRGISRIQGALVVTFAVEAAEVVEAFAAAERVCCAGITWEVERGAETTLKITTNDDALDALNRMSKTTV